MCGFQPRDEVVDLRLLRIRWVVGVVLEVADFVVDIRAGGGGVEDLEMGWVEIEEGDDVCADARRGCCCEGADGDRRVLQRALEP